MTGLLMAVAWAGLSAAGESRPLDTMVPAQAMVVHFGRPSPDMLNAPPGGTVDQLAGWIITLKAMGVIPQEGRVIADVIASLPMLARRPHALVLLDVTLKPLGEQSYRLNDLQAALVIDSAGMAADLDRRLRDLLATYTDAAAGRIEALEANAVRYHRLSDARLPAWVVVEWATIDGHVLIGLGAGAFQRMLDTIQRGSAALADDPWYRSAHRLCHGATSGIEVFADFARLKARLGEVAKEQPSAVARALGLEQVDRLLWTVGFDGRAMRSEAFARETGGPDHHVLLAGRDLAAPEVIEAIPPEAGGYAVFRVPLGDLVNNSRRAYRESQSPGGRRRLQQDWGRLEREFDFDVESGFIDRLGEHVAFHTYPPHPLKLPLLCTIWIQHGGPRATVSKTLDAMMTAWQRYMQGPEEARPAISLRPQLVRDPDGVWYVQLGLVGPAVAVADRWIVISFSPQAVRTNLEYLQNVHTPP